MNLLEKEAVIANAAIEYEDRTPQQLLAWAVQNFPNITLACSFGAEDVVLTDMLYSVKPDASIFYLDTDFHFQETYETRDRLMEKYPQFNFIQVKSALTPEEQAEQYGEALWKSNPNQCCDLRKVQPLTKILTNYEAWVTGIRRDQAPTRANSKKVEYDTKFGLIKFNPLASWTTDEVWDYIHKNEVIYNPLHDQNYPSIGCLHCTRQVMPGEDIRAGRWSDSEKIECGLHQE